MDHDWVLVYSTFRDGISLRTMYRNMYTFENEDTPVVLVVRDSQDKVCGMCTLAEYLIIPVISIFEFVVIYFLFPDIWDSDHLSSEIK